MRSRWARLFHRIWDFGMEMVTDVDTDPQTVEHQKEAGRAGVVFDISRLV